MYVCICNNVTESDIDRAISDGAISLGCVKEKLGVATCCGQCEDRASEYVDTALPKQAMQTLKVERVTNNAVSLTASWSNSPSPAAV